MTSSVRQPLAGFHFGQNQTSALISESVLVLNVPFCAQFANLYFSPQ